MFCILFCQSLCQELDHYRKSKCQSFPRVHVSGCTRQTPQKRWTSCKICCVLDTRRAARTPARYGWISLMCFFVLWQHTRCIGKAALSCSALGALWHLPVVTAECVSCVPLRGTQAGLSSARWSTGRGCRQEWSVLDWAVLTETSRACTHEWLASPASSATRYPSSGCLAEPISCGLGGLPCCSAACPLYWPCFWNENLFRNLSRWFKRQPHLNEGGAQLCIWLKLYHWKISINTWSHNDMKNYLHFYSGRKLVQ